MSKYLLATCLVYTLVGVALPVDPQVTEGTAFFSQTDSSILEIASSDRVAIDWNSFSVDSHETVKFLQPNSHSIAINRITGEHPSILLGKIDACGQILFLNPHGIVFGKECQINVGSMIASTLDLQSAFHAQGSIRNLGSITTSKGDLILISPHLENSGLLTAHQGNVSMIAAIDVDLGPQNRFQINDLGHSTVCLQSGQIRSIFPECGGTISLIGNSVKLGEASVCNVSHDIQGGSIWIGALRSDLPLSETVFVAPTALLEASSLAEGAGGRIVIHSTQWTGYSGLLRATGGSFRGDGGHAEVSSLGKLGFDGTAELFALNGRAGLLTLDPTDVTISAAASTAGVTIGNPTTLPPSTPVNILNTAINAVLNGGSNVLVTTAVLPDQGANGDITVTAPLSWMTSNVLTLIASRDLNFNAGSSITSTGVGAAANLTAGRNMTVVAGANLSASGSGTNFTLNAQNDILIQANVQNTAPIGGSACAISVTSTAGSIQIAAPLTQSVTVGPTNGTATVSACSDVTLTGSSGVTCFAVIGQDAGNSAGNISVFAGRDLFILGGNGVRSYAGISRLGPQQVAAARVDGDISVSVVRNATLQGGLNALTNGYIGHGGNHGGAGASRKWGNITVNVGNDLSIVGGAVLLNTNRAFIGNDAFSNDTRSTIRINVGNDLLLGNGIANSISFIGAGADSVGAGERQTTFINVGRRLILNGTQGGAFLQPMNDNGVPGLFPPFLSVHVGGDMICLGGMNSLAGGYIRYHVGAATPWSTEIFALGNIVCLNGSSSAAGLFMPVLNNNFGSIDVRAGGDIRNAGGIPSFSIPSPIINFITPGSISFQADYTFTSGQLWNGATVPPVTVCGTSLFSTSPLGTSSTNSSTTNPSRSGGDGRGGIAFDFARYNVTAFNFATLTAPLIAPATTPIEYRPAGNLVMISSNQFDDGTTANLTIGAANGQIRFHSTTGNIHIEGFEDIFLANVPGIGGFALEANLGNIFVSAQNNIQMTNSAISAGGSVTLVVDEQDPFRPLIGPGAFIMDALSSIDSTLGSIGIYTALQSQNQIDLNALFNGTPIATLFSNAGLTFNSTTLFQNTNLENWCVYFSDGIPPIPLLTIFYKNCLNLVVQQATIIIDEMLVDLHPYNEFPGWLSHFVIRSLVPDYEQIPDESFSIRRRNLNFFNHPKSWTLLLPE